MYGKTDNYGFDRFSSGPDVYATDATAGDVICAAGDEGSGYDWFYYWQAGAVVGPTQLLSRFPWNCYYTFIKSANDVVGLLAGVDLSEAQKSYLGFAKALTAPSSIWTWPVCTIRSKTSTPTYRASKADRSHRGREHHRGYGPQQPACDARRHSSSSKITDGRNCWPITALRRRPIRSLAVVYGIKARAYLAGRFRLVEVCRRRDLCPQSHRRFEMAYDHDPGGVAEPQNRLQQVQWSWMWYLRSLPKASPTS